MDTVAGTDETLLPMIIAAIENGKKPDGDWIGRWGLTGLFDDLVESGRIPEAMRLASVVAKNGRGNGALTENGGFLGKTLEKLVKSGHPVEAVELAGVYIKSLPTKEILGNTDYILEDLANKGVDPQVVRLAYDAFSYAPEKEKLRWACDLVESLGDAAVDDELVSNYARMCSDAMPEVPFAKKMSGLIGAMDGGNVSDKVIAKFAVHSVAQLPDEEKAGGAIAVFKAANHIEMSGSDLEAAAKGCLENVPQEARLRVIQGMTNALRSSMGDDHDDRKADEIYEPGMAFLQYCHRTAGTEYKDRVYGLTTRFVRFLLMENDGDVSQLLQYGEWCQKNAPTVGAGQKQWARLSKAFAKKGVPLQSAVLTRTLSKTAEAMGICVEGAK
jgi:hypothetical protein